MVHNQEEGLKTFFAKRLVTKLQTNQNVRQVLLHVNSNEKWTGMKNTKLKTPEKYQIYVLVRFHTIKESKL